MLRTQTRISRLKRGLKPVLGGTGCGEGGRDWSEPAVCNPTPVETRDCLQGWVASSPGLAAWSRGLVLGGRARSASVKVNFRGDRCARCARAAACVLRPPLVCSVHVVKRAFEPFHCQNLLQWLPRSLALLGSQSERHPTPRFPARTRNFADISRFGPSTG